MKIDGIAQAVNRKFSSKNEGTLSQTGQLNFNQHNENNAISKTLRASFGKQDTKNGILDSLMKQKENIIKNRSDLITRTQENGGSMESIKDQLANYDDQLKTIDEQMSKMMIEQQTEALGQKEKDEDKSQTSETVPQKPKTVLEMRSENLNGIMKLTTSMEQAKTLDSVRTQAVGQAKVLESEIALDQSITGNVVDSKRDGLRSLYQTINDIENSISKIQSSIQNKAADLSDVRVESSKEEMTEYGSAVKSEREQKITEYKDQLKKLDEPEKDTMIRSRA